MSDQGSVQGQSALSRSGSATLLKKTKAPSKDHASHIHFGVEPPDFVSCAAEAYGPKPGKSASEVAAFHDNKKYLRGVHWTLGGDSAPMGISTAKAAYQPPGPAPKDAMFGDKTSNQKTQWSMGFENEPDHYTTCHQAELCEPSIARGQATGPSDHSEKIALARSTTITLGSDAPNYQSQSRSSHINFGRQAGVEPGLAEARTKQMRVSNFHFGNEEDAGPTTTESATQYKFHGDPTFLKDQLVAAIPGAGTKGLQKTHLHLGNAPPVLKSEFQNQFGAVDDLMEAAKHPCRLDPEQKRELRIQHFYLGTDSGPCNSEAAEAFGQRALRPGGEKAMAAEMANLLAIRKDLRATHINLGNDNVKDITSTAKESYSHPIGKKVGASRDDGEALKPSDHQKANWTVGIDDESLREHRMESMAHQDFADGVAKVNYGQLASLDEETKADLRKSHFYFGKESFPKHSSSRDAYVAHKSKPYVIPEHVMADLRKEHFTFGTDEGLGQASKTTSQEAMIYHGAKAYKTDTNSAKETKKQWARTSVNTGSHSGPRLSVMQEDFKMRQGL